MCVRACVRACQIRHIPEELAETGKCDFKNDDIARLMGRTFLLSSAVNLYSDILDVPDFFWENGGEAISNS